MMRYGITTLAILACLWTLFVLLNAKVLMGEVMLLATEDALSLMVAQVVLVPCLLYLALRRPKRVE